jgi:hypothetical protein
MSKIRRLEEHRFIGTRDDMVVYDTDDPGQEATLETRVVDDDLISATLISTFGPDTIEEARSRGFSPAPN